MLAAFPATFWCPSCCSTKAIGRLCPSFSLHRCSPHQPHVQSSLPTSAMHAAALDTLPTIHRPATPASAAKPTRLAAPAPAMGSRAGTPELAVAPMQPVAVAEPVPDYREAVCLAGLALQLAQVRGGTGGWAPAGCCGWLARWPMLRVHVVSPTPSVCSAAMDAGGCGVRHGAAADLGDSSVTRQSQLLGLPRHGMGALAAVQQTQTKSSFSHHQQAPTLACLACLPICLPASCVTPRPHWLAFLSAGSPTTPSVAHRH